ncbi:MAG: hypothetical protein JST61_08230 [Acidobacteria bacterium]|nr:hypothetical protein [Acidobacteriota bacterium]
MEEPPECAVEKIDGLPGSHGYAADFIEATAMEPGSGDQNTFWALTADLSETVPPDKRAMYISKTTDGGRRWEPVARVGPSYFEAQIGEGLRNGFIVAPGGRSFVLTTQKGAFEVIPTGRDLSAIIHAIDGPRVQEGPSKVPLTKKPGEPVRANVAAMTSDGRTLYLGFGYFDLTPQLYRYRRGDDGQWVREREIRGLPSEMDLLSIQFDDPRPADPRFMYVGTGDQAYLLDLHTERWSRVDGVGADSAIHGMTVVGGLHIAACWGVYNPVGPGMVAKVTSPSFLYHVYSDEAGPNVRAYSVDVDPARMNRAIVTSITGVYMSDDKGLTWRRINSLPEGEYRTAHFDEDGTVLVSGMPGTFLINPFSEVCMPRLKRR